MEQRITTQSHQNWLAKLLGYEFDIVYKIGALSRMDEEKELQGLSKPYWQEVTESKEEVQDPNSHGKYTLENDRLYYKGKLVLAAN